MPAPREQGGGVSEASRLLQEGLELLAARSREVDALVTQAEERASRVTAEAEERAQEITAEAERRRAELEEQVAALRAEVAAVREELAQLRAAPPPKGGGSGISPVGGVAAAEDGASPTSVEADSAPTDAMAVTDAGIAEQAEAAGTPRWGRPSSIASAQQAIRTRAARPRWLPPWLPFLIVLLAAAGVVTATVDGQGGARPTNTDPPPTNVIAVTIAPTRVAPTRAAPATAESGLGVAAATSLATSIVVAASALPQQTAASATAAGSEAGPRAATSSAPQTSRQTATLVATAVTLPPARASVTTPVALPAEVSPEGPIVAAYTTYSTYIVRRGDTLNRVATEFGVSGDIIVRASGIADPNLLLPGQVLTIPRDSGWLYRVQPNETLDQIAARFGISRDELMMASVLPSAIVRTGDLLFIPNRVLPAPKL